MQQSDDWQLGNLPEFSNWSDAKTQRQMDYEQLKEELQISDDHLKKLRMEQSDVSHAFEEVCTGTNVSHCILLRKKLMRIGRELNYEENVNQHIKQLLDQTSYDKTVEQISAAKLCNIPKRNVNKQLEADRINQELRFTQQTKAMIASVQRFVCIFSNSMTCLENTSEREKATKGEFQSLQTKKEARRRAEMLVHEKMFSSAINLKNSIEKSKVSEMLYGNASCKTLEKQKDSIAARKARQLSELSAVRDEENDLRTRAASSSLDVDKEVALNRRMAQIDARHRDSTLSYAHRLAMPKKVDRPDVSQVEKVEETFEDDEQKDGVDAELLTTISKGKQTTPGKQPTKLEQVRYV
ncbi:hypothetical protein P879_05834 [Paragonimus westermani]|uniref:Uncharacterized protein n=1 Tax=Paragonimus westermani TaxID=34504 RepID=A0A8T0DUM6_9TREM|nr:hypothetical protein P879_05834 [Paragonimus westermani]